MPIVYLTPFIVAGLGYGLSGPILALFAFLAMAGSLICVQLSHMPLKWESPEDKRKRQSGLLFMCYVALFFAVGTSFAFFTFDAHRAEKEVLKPSPDSERVSVWTY